MRLASNLLGPNTVRELVFLKPLPQKRKGGAAECSGHNPTLHFNPLTQPTGLVSIALTPPPPTPTAQREHAIASHPLKYEMALQSGDPRGQTLWAPGKNDGNRRILNSGAAMEITSGEHH